MLYIVIEDRYDAQLEVYFMDHFATNNNQASKEDKKTVSNFRTYCNNFKSRAGAGTLWRQLY
uniref:Uncharacterized protein n=1 Tax=Romanomermis culicivorax TaxID=13658 RepID=A0A915JNZ3_ROMCU